LHRLHGRPPHQYAALLGDPATVNLSLPPRPSATIIDPDVQRRIRRKPILGGLINEYELAA
jgi:hypothetical protein